MSCDQVDHSVCQWILSSRDRVHEATLNKSIQCHKTPDADSDGDSNQGKDEAKPPAHNGKSQDIKIKQPSSHDKSTCSGLNEFQSSQGDQPSTSSANKSSSNHEGTSIIDHQEMFSEPVGGSPRLKRKAAVKYDPRRKSLNSDPTLNCHPTLNTVITTTMTTDEVVLDSVAAADKSRSAKIPKMQSGVDTSKPMSSPRMNRCLNISAELDEDVQMCQNPQLCPAADTPAVKICHHSDCQDSNNHKPLMLCADCDANIHENTSLGHLRFDLRPKAFVNGFGAGRRSSSRSLTEPDQNSDNEAELEDDVIFDDVDGIDNDTAITEEAADCDDAPDGGIQIVINTEQEESNANIDTTDLSISPETLYSKNKASAKIKRKKVIKRERTDRRYHTDGYIEKYRNDIGKDCFTVRMELWEQPELELISAKAGITLRDALIPIFEKRQINVDAVHIYLQASNTPLPLVFDTFRFGGSQLIVKAKEGADPFAKPPKAAVQKSKSSIGRKKGAVVLEDMTNTEMSSSPHGTLTQTDIKQLQRPRSQSKFMTSLFSPFVKDKEKQEALADLLNGYSYNGLPEMPALLTMGKPQYDSSLLEIEEHWSNIVHNSEELSKKKKVPTATLR